MEISHLGVLAGGTYSYLKFTFCSFAAHGRRGLFIISFYFFRLACHFGGAEECYLIRGKYTDSGFTKQFA